MSNLRDRLRIRTNKTISNQSDGVKRSKRWGTTDKHKMVQAIKKYGADEIQLIKRNCFPKRSVDEITKFIEDVRESIGENHDPEEKREDPHHWSEICDKLLEEVPDYSYCLGKVFEDHLSTNVFPMTTSQRQPKWLLIYKYITCLLNDHPLPDLGQVEAGVMLMLLEDLISNYHSMDTSDQSLLVKTKHSLLTCLGNSEEENKEIIKKALNLSILKAKVPQNTPEMQNEQHVKQISPHMQQTQQEPLGTEKSQRSTPQENLDDSKDVTGNMPQSSMNEIKSIQLIATNESSLSPLCLASNSKVCILPASKSRQEEPLYSINPLCIPISYLNPKPTSVNA